MRKSLFLRIFLGYAVVIVFLAGAVALFAPGLMRNHFIKQQSSGLEHLEALIEDSVLRYLEGKETGSLEDYVRMIEKKTGARLTIISRDGKVLADSEKEPQDMENHQNRPEIFTALQGEPRMSIRFSATLQREMMYMAFPLRADGQVIGVLRLSLFVDSLNRLFDGFRADILKTVGLATLLALFAAFFFTRSISRPIQEFSQAAARVAAGDLEAKVSIWQRGEFMDFARSFNAMTEELKASFEEVQLQSEELTSILGSIEEGLCVLDADGRITLSNDGFRRIVQNDHPETKHSWEVVRSSDFAAIVKKARESMSGAAGEFSLADRVYACSVSYLPTRNRFVVMLHDMTEFRNLERVKKDFVINVSHELKTPLTAIKGFIETMEPTIGPENRAYLEIVRRNTERLIAIVGDLLVLSELEEKGSRLRKEAVDVRALAGTIVRIFEKQARDKGLELSVEGSPDLPPLQADPYEIERLLLNLVDNAVKYTDKGRVTVRLAASAGRLTIEVSDTGIGIDGEHLPHIFERFYVADKSRSKKLGGTGLGLSIAKHIVLAHEGTISVKSRLGEGSTFTVSLPVS
jgi:two-component system phosphate regulon sensor histidine kinase PhoR